MSVRKASGPGRWQGVEIHEYKQAGSAPFREVSRQVLFSDPALAAQWRYFEVAPGGHSTLERHEHMHAVMILVGQGMCLVGDALHALAPHDLVHIPAWTWHQFRATEGSALGFLCLVNAERDRPCLPGEADLAELRKDQRIAAFIRA